MLTRLAPLFASLLVTSLASAQKGVPPWGQWRGANRTGVNDQEKLRPSWPDEGPKKVFRTNGLGAGFSSVTFAGDLVFTMGDEGNAARLFALDRQTGEVRWSARVGSPGGTRNPGPRSTPATDGERVYGLGHDGSLVCMDAKTGKNKDMHWRRNLRKDFGGRMMSGWGFSESPLLDGDLLICTPGGKDGTVMALDKKSGEPVWRTTALRDRAAYSSIVPVVLCGVRQYLVFTGKSVAGIAPADGALLWRGNRPGKTAICSDPVVQGDLVFVSSGYKVGCNLFRVTTRKAKKKRNRFAVEEVYSGKQMQSHHGGLVRVGDHVYGLGRRNLKCIELATGKVVWEERSVGKGSITAAGGHLIVRGERRGEVALVRATPKGYAETGRFVPEARSEEPAWAHPVVFGGRLYIRDQDTLLVYQVGVTDQK